MPAPLSKEVRERIASFVVLGGSTREAARLFKVSPSAAWKITHRLRETGSIAPAKMGGYRRQILEGQEKYLCDLIRARGSITLTEIKVELAQRGIAVSKTSIWAMLKKLVIGDTAASIDQAEVRSTPSAGHSTRLRRSEP